MVKNLLLTAIAATALTACGADYQPNPYATDTYIEPEFADIVQEYADATGNDVAYSMRFDNDKAFNIDIIGYCFDDIGPGRHMRLRKSFWDHASPADQRLLLLHELGHCSGHLDHNMERFWNKCPKSLMFPIIVPVSLCARNGTEYPINGSDASKP